MTKQRKLPPKVQMQIDETEPINTLVYQFFALVKREGSGWSANAMASVTEDLMDAYGDRERVLRILRSHTT